MHLQTAVFKIAASNRPTGCANKSQSPRKKSVSSKDSTDLSQIFRICNLVCEYSSSRPNPEYILDIYIVLE